MGFESFKSAPPVSGRVAVTQAVPSASTAEPSPSVAPQEEQSSALEQSTTTVTPSGVTIEYAWAPRRLYRLNGTEVPSVTTVLGVLDKSGPLTWWAQGIGAVGVLELYRKGEFVTAREQQSGEALLGFEPRPGEFALPTMQQLNDLLTKHKLSVNHVKDKAADRGVNVHAALELWVAEGIIPDPEGWLENERGYIAGLAAFMASVTPGCLESNLESELMVGSLKHQYAGRFDLVLTLSKPVEVVTKCYPKKPPRIEEIPAGRYLLDLKTSKRVYDTHFLQLEAYEAAAVECGYAPTDYRGVVHVTADGKYELALNKDWTIEDFLTVRACYQTMNERKIVQALRDELDAKEVA